MLLQLWHVGRQSHVDRTAERPGSRSAPSAIQRWRLTLAPRWPRHRDQYREQSSCPIYPGLVDEYRKGAERGQVAGFDGVEVHAAWQRLPDRSVYHPGQSSNRRTDAYGGSVGSRTRFLPEVVEAVTSVWGNDSSPALRRTQQ